jgi:flagellar motility protein MotE (MotC chaperone)
MIKWLGEFRLMPIVLIAIGSLFALKTLGLIFDGGYSLGDRMSGGGLVVTTVPMKATAQLQSPSAPLETASGQSSSPKISWMQEMFNYPGGDITGSVHGSKPKEPPKEAAKEPAKEPGKEGEAEAKKGPVNPPETKPAGVMIPMDGMRPPSAAERALLERLQERRQELDARARELDLRETLLKAAEKKLESQAAAQKADEANGGSPSKRKEEAEAARLKGLVTMYETMKPKDAAKIFDRLDTKVLLDMASHIKPQRMSEIMAQMSPENAERLTVELASRGASERTVDTSKLPKIEGKPSGS